MPREFEHIPHYHYHPPHHQHLTLSPGGGNGGGDSGGLVGAIGVSMAANPALWIVGGIIIGGIIIYALTREEEA
jgi:hypothetical protein